MTISYGRWSSEVFFLFFGFVVGDNPWDSVTVFRDLPEMIAYHDELEVRLCAGVHMCVIFLAACNASLIQPQQLWYCVLSLPCSTRQLHRLRAHCSS